ncbi:Ig-like domain repeat protein, partial [Methanobrevibacter sp.]|uniref:Ig-like domain repeat protein n=1 Tax=Methanobrevibacter sp. TaxID=66852 RepID=UPI00386D0503
MKNSFKLLFFTILILTLFLSLSDVCATDFDNSTMEIMDDEQDLDLIESPDFANDNYNSDELGMEDSNQDLDSDSSQSDLSVDLKEYKTTNSEVNSPIHKSNAKNGDVLKATNSISLNAGASSKVYVNYNSGNDANSGASWSKAVKTIEKALTLIDDDGVIYIADGVTHLSDSTGSEGININKKVSIIGQSVNSVISGNKNKRIFNIGLNADVFLSNLTLTEGDSSNGGAISIESSSETSYGKLTISDSIISNCHATSRGGAIYSNTGSVSNLNNVTFINDSSVSNGGAIAIQQKGSLSNINDCKFINNSADNRGGAVYLGSGSTCAIGNNNLFEGNKAFDRYGYGGAIHGANGIALGTGNVFVNNYAEKGGSALSTLNNKEISGSFCFFINNTAIDGHSLVYGNKITVTLENCYWASNTPAFENFVYNQNTWNPNNYLILSISSNDSVVSGNKIPVKVDLSKNQNNQAVDVNSLPKSIPVLFTAANGNFDSSSTKMVNGIAKTNYIAGTVGNDNITVDVYGVTSILSINVLPKIGTLFVNYTAGSDSNNGASWSKAVKTISHALDIAAEDSSIYVAGGINYLDNTGVNGLTISKNISIIGIGDNAIIDAKNAGRIFYIDGFTVNLSNLIFANANASNANAKRGGVIWARNSVLNIENCKFINNTAGNSNSYGGAINLKSSTAKINGSYFDNNVALNGGAINAENNVLDILNSIFTSNKILSNGHGKSINQYKNCDLTIKNSVLLDGPSSVQIANVSKALLEDNWWGNNNLNRDLSPTLNCTNGNVNSYLILETSINKKTVHVGDEVTITTSLNRNQNGNVKNNLIELPININANLGTAVPNETTINNKLSSIYNPTVPGSEVITVDVLGIKNVLSFVVKNAIPKLTIDEVSTSWSLGIYSGVANSFDIKLINNENRKIDNVVIELVSNESSKVLGSFKGSINKGNSTISIVDNTIREITEKTVWPDAQNNLIKFNVKLKYDGETISTVSVDKILAYNGYFNKTYSYGGHDNVINRKYTINGDIIIATQDEEVYKDQFSRFRNETWNIKTPKNAEIVKVLLYFNYNWDTSFFPDGWTLKFNNHNILNEYVSHETDRGNLGVWGAYDYGLLVFDVTDYYKANADNSFIINKTGNCALYPSTLYVLYNLTNSNMVKDVYFSDICDVFYPLYNQNGYDDLLKFVVNFNDVDLTRLHEANWYVFSGSSSLNNNLSFNNMTIANPFAGYTPNDCRPYDYNVTNLINQNNEAWFISGVKSSTTVAYEQVLVVERNNFVPSMSVSVEDISVGDIAKIIVKLPSDASGNVTASVDGKSVSGKVQKGKVTLSVSGLTSGSKKAFITYSGDGKYLSSTKTKTFIVNKVVPSMSVSVGNISVGDVAKVIVELPSDASGNVAVSVDGKSVSGKVQKGKASVSVSGLTSGSKKASITYSGDGKYLSCNGTGVFVVSKVVPSMSVSVEDISVGDVAKIIVELPSDASGNVTANVDGKSVSGKVQKGKVTLSIPGLTSGTKEATVSYSGDEKYIQKSCTEIFKVNKIIKNMTVSMDSSNVETTIVQVSNLPSDASGIVTVTIAGKSNSSKVSNGKATVKIHGLTNGTQSAHIIYSDDDKYEVNPVTTGLDVNKLNVTLKINVNDINVGEKASIVVSISPSAATGTINALIDGVDSGSSSISKGKATISISDLTSGTKSVIVIYSGDDKYNANSAASEFTVSKVVPSMSVSAGDICVGDVAKVIVKLPSDASGNVT